MKITEIRTLPDEQLADMIDVLLEEWRDLRFKHTVGQMQQTKRIWQIRRTIARIKTVQTERVEEERIAAQIGATG
jgi:large subunit ribosomal protein L29